VWAVFEAIRDGFDLKPGNGRLKNNMDPTINNMDCADAKPPDMLINVVLGTNDAIIYPMVAEIQVHLADINKLKHENHILYKVRRAESASELRQSTAPPAAPPPAVAVVAAPAPVVAALGAALPPLGAPASSAAADALAAENAALKAQMAKMVPAEEHAKQLLEQQREAEGKVVVGERVEVAALKAQMAKMVPAEELAKLQREAEEKAARRVEDFARQLELKTEELQGELELKTEELQGMEELLLEQAGELDAVQSSSSA
jgi:hypothetical protein